MLGALSKVYIVHGFDLHSQTLAAAHSAKHALYKDLPPRLLVSREFDTPEDCDLTSGVSNSRDTKGATWLYWLGVPDPQKLQRQHPRGYSSECGCGLSELGLPQTRVRGHS